MTTTSRKQLGGVLICASVIVAALLQFCGVRMISFQSEGTAHYGYQHFEMSWLVFILLAGLATGFYLLVRRGKS